ncbi:hypothetical protein DA89_3713 [Vibrio cholerae]|nr:hypothetical protein DA89_3713 [Vibrio cholerae]
MFFDFPLTLTINLEASSIDSKVLNRSFGFCFETHVNVFGSTTDTTVVWAAQWELGKLKNGIHKALRSTQWHGKDTLYHQSSSDG